MMQPRDRLSFSPIQHTFEEILSRDGVVAWDGSQILDWYLAQQRQRG
jgi:hypothetical protein